MYRLSLAKWWLLRVGLPLTLIVTAVCAVIWLQDGTLVRKSVNWRGATIDLRIYERRKAIYVAVSERGLGRWSQVIFLADAESVDSSDAEIIVDQESGEVVLRCDTAQAIFDLRSHSLRVHYNHPAGR